MDAIADAAGLRPAAALDIAIAQPGQLTHLVGVHEQIAELRIERHAAPVDAAVVAGKRQAQPVVARRQVGAADLHAFEQLLALRFELRRDRRDVRRRERHARQRRRLDRERLRLRGALERHFARRHRPFLDTVDRLAVDAIQQEEQSRLADGGHGRNRAAALLHVEQHRRVGDVGVPDVVMHELEVPEILAGVGVGRDEARAEQVVALAIAAELIDRRRAERHVDDAALRVDGDEAPDVDAGAVLPAVARPGVVVLLAGSRDRMERPDQLAGVHVPRADVARRPERRILLRAPAGDDQVLEHDRRRAEAVVARQALQDLRRVEIDDALVAEGFVRLAGLGVQRDQPAVMRAEDDLRRSLVVAGPVLDAARRRHAGRHLVGPQLLTGRRIQRHDLAVRRADVHHAVDDDRRRLADGEP